MESFEGLKAVGHGLGVSGTRFVSPFGASVWSVRLGRPFGDLLRVST